RGQVGQPSPEPVTRTTAPLTVMPALTTTDAIAQPRMAAGVGAQNESRRAKGEEESVGSFTSSMVRAGGGGPFTGFPSPDVCDILLIRRWADVRRDRRRRRC